MKSSWTNIENTQAIARGGNALSVVRRRRLREAVSSRASMGDSFEIQGLQSSPQSCAGPCRRCGAGHSLPAGNARRHARRLMREFELIRRLDHLAPNDDADPALSFDRLFPGGHGNMFGVLECEDAQGRTVVLRAFSSLKRGIRDVDGWVPPNLSGDTYYGIILPAQQKLEELTAELELLDDRSAGHRDLLAQRKRTSRALFAEMQDRYRFRNFRGEERTLRAAYWPARANLPGGIGECCAPKLLDHAARRGLRPRGIAEF